MTKLESLIKSLEKANRRLKEAADLSPNRINKDATIQRFEFTFELAWKTIQEYVRDQGLDCKSPKGCIREGARLSILARPETWFKFLDNRNLITHTYNEKLADRVYRHAVKFSKEVDKLLDTISSNL